MTRRDKSPQRDRPAPGDESRLRTRTAVLDAAERLFSERGVDGTSVRDITTAAAANLGAVNYHFGSKDGLMLEVFARRLEPVNRQRIAQLDFLEKAAGKRPVALAKIVEAFVRPSVEIETGGGTGHREDILRLLSRSFHEPDPKLKKFVEEQFSEVARRFDAAIMQAVPKLAQGELFWRMSFFIGALHHSQGVWLRFSQHPRPGNNSRVVRPDREDFIRRITAFVTAGMREPSSSKPERTRQSVPARRSPSKPRP